MKNIIDDIIHVDITNVDNYLKEKLKNSERVLEDVKYEKN